MGSTCDVEKCRVNCIADSFFFPVPTLLRIQGDDADRGGHDDDGRSHHSRILFSFGNEGHPAWRHTPSTLNQSSEVPPQDTSSRNG